MAMRLQVKENKVRILVRCALLLCIAMVLSYLENILVLRFALLPFMKIGLANIIVTLAFFELSTSEAFAVSTMRVIIMGVLFGSMISFFYSAMGTFFAFGGLFLSKWLGKRVSYIGTSVICACLHNLGQAVVAALFFGLRVASFYLPYLLIFGAVFGTLTGILLNFISQKYKKVISK